MSIEPDKSIKMENNPVRLLFNLTETYEGSKTKIPNTTTT